MKTTLFFITLLYSATLFAVQVKIPNTNISIVTPTEFESLSEDVIKAKWPARRAPEWVVGNESTSTSIAFGLRPADISNVPLTQLMENLKQTMSRVGPGVEWLKTEVIDINGKDWVYLEFTSNAINADIHNIMLASSHHKQMALFNFNSTKEEFIEFEDKLRTSIQSISFDN